MNKLFIVTREELWESSIEVEGDDIKTAKDARNAVAEGEGYQPADSKFIRYNDNSDQWHVTSPTVGTEVTKETKLTFTGTCRETGEKVKGWLLSRKPFQRCDDKGMYYILCNEDWELEEQINYLKNPKDFAHLKDSVYEIYQNSLEVVM